MNKLIFIAFILLCSCASINKVESSLETKKSLNEYPYFDAGLKVHYQITNDEKNIHLKLMSSDYATVLKILKSGLQICFDVKGRKSDKVFFEYPLVQKQVFSDRIMLLSNRGKPQNNNLIDLISKVPNEALLNDHGQIDRFLVTSSDTDIKVSITPKRNNTIIYDLLIPINRISKNGFSALSNLSIGIVTVKGNVASISHKFPDISGGDANGDVPPGNLYGRIYHEDKTFYVPATTTSTGAAEVNNDLRMRPIDKYDRSNSASKYKSNEFWFKIHLQDVK